MSTTPKHLRTIALATVAACALLTPALASAEEAQPPAVASPTQTVEPNNVGYPPVTGEKPIHTADQQTIPGETPGYLFNPSSLGAGFGKDLASHGVYLHGFYQQADLSVVDGGHKQQSEYVGLGYWGTDVDTEKAFGLKGGLIDFTMSTQLGNTGAAGNSTGSQTLVPWGFGDGVRLVDLYYNQTLFDGGLQITVGRMNQLTGEPNLSPGFHVTPWLCTFWSNSCGTPHAFNFNANKPGYQVGSWGGTFTIHPARFWYFKAGVIENQPLENSTHTHLGWPGRDWGLNEAVGAFLPMQLGYITTPATSLYPTNFHIGGYFDTATYADKYYNTRGQPLALFGGAPLMHNKASGVWGAIQQTVWRFNDNPRSLRGMALFASGDWDVQGYGDDQQQYEAGVIVTGPFPSRAADSLNILVTRQVFDPRLKAARDAVATAHKEAYAMHDQTGFEVNYGFAAAPGLILQPYVQYVDNPDQLGLAVPDPHDGHALVTGFRITARFDTLFGLPQPGA